MEKHLEHKIEEAYQKKDVSTSYPQKEELWSRISNAQKSKSAVHGFWRVVAVLLAVFFITGAFSSILFINKNMKQLVHVEKTNYELHVIVDSLQNLTPRTITEIKYIEKEVKIFVPVEKGLVTNTLEKEQIKMLTQENIQLKKQFKTESAIWQNKSDSLKQELIVLNKTIEIKSDIQKKAKTPSSDVVELKPGKYEIPLQQPTQSANPKMKLQLFSNPDEKTNFDMNSTIFKK